MKKPLFWIILTVAFIGLVVLGWKFYEYNKYWDNLYKEHSWKIGKSAALEHEGRSLFKQGRYDEALNVLKEASDKKYLIDPKGANGMAHLLMRRIYFMRGEYEKALEDTRQMLKVAPEQKWRRFEEAEYLAIIQYRDTGNPQPVLDHIANIKKAYAASLPPIG
jgi:pentatricopeptide repeat protein